MEDMSRSQGFQTCATSEDPIFSESYQLALDILPAAQPELWKPQSLRLCDLDRICSTNTKILRGPKILASQFKSIRHASKAIFILKIQETPFQARHQPFTRCSGDGGLKRLQI
jgi:hypothetical protein